MVCGKHNHVAMGWWYRGCLFSAVHTAVIQSMRLEVCPGLLIPEFPDIGWFKKKIRKCRVENLCFGLLNSISDDIIHSKFARCASEYFDLLSERVENNVKAVRQKTWCI